MERRTVFTPEVALGTKTMPSLSAFMNSEKVVIASAHNFLAFTSKKFMGSDSRLSLNFF